MKDYSKITETTRFIPTVLGRYHKALMTEDFVFFCNYRESDENGMCIMFRRNPNDITLELVSNNYFAYVGFMETQVEIYKGDTEAKYMSPTMKMGYQYYINEGEMDEYAEAMDYDNKKNQE